MTTSGKFLPTRNAADFLEEALLSILQDLPVASTKDASGEKRKKPKESILQIIKAIDSVESWSDRLCLEFCSKIHHAYYCLSNYPKHRKSLFVALLRFWSSGDETLRLRAALGLVTFCRAFPSGLERCARKMYLVFLKVCKGINPHNIHILSLMTNSLVEIFSLNINALSGFVFASIRKLADAIRQAVKNTGGNKVKKIFSWSFCAALKLWGIVLARFDNNHINLLVSPFTSLIMEICCIQPSGQFAAFYLQMIRIALNLMESKQTFIPVNHILGQHLKYICSKRIEGSAKNIVGSTHCLSFLVKVSASELEKPSYKEALFEECHLLLIRFISIVSNWACFPEIGTNCLNMINSALSGCQHQKFKASLSVSKNKLQKLIDSQLQSRAAAQMPPTSFDQNHVDTNLSSVDFKKYASSLGNIHQLKEKDLLAASKANKACGPKASTGKGAALNAAKKRKAISSVQIKNDKEDKLVKFEL